ncbi:unnamed protein product [Dovyalis caffra]|uniref:Nudix hydrolase domain-containing protein n=1 Tax=Dovyalis caffra TaxID=77055 RepID=A0AAV1S078_9ROSI|nr:unnamed protein product [Dovyalis caffra]
MESCDSIVRNSYIYRSVTPNCPVNLNKFASVPLSGSSCSALSLTRSRRRSRRRKLPPLMETPPDGYRRNVGICLVNPSRKGGAGEGEDLRNAAMRELREETGVTSAEFVAEFTGKEEEINLLGDGSETPEFKDWAWLLPERVLELAVDFKKPVYEQVMKVFGQYLEADADEGDCAGQLESKAEVPRGVNSCVN